MLDTTPYKMTLSLNVLNHLGLNLYSNIPAVLSETVANAWDADAESVTIDIDRTQERITITDDGNGMNLADVNNKYLCVGYRKLDEPNGRITPKFKRSAMGRKGIGKLSLFSIARKVELHTIKDGEKHRFLMDVNEIKKKIENSEGVYTPQPLDLDMVTIKKGTQIILTDLKKNLNQTIPALRRRLARRFGVIDSENYFDVSINGKPIDITDRDYYRKVQHIWYFGEESRKYSERAVNVEHIELRDNKILGTDYSVSGWIGTVKSAGDLTDDEDNLNKIILMVRGKLAQEDILDDFNEGGVYSKYLIGEIHADFLDTDEDEDIATSNRQKIDEDDPRYLALKKFVYQELKNIQNKWTNLRDVEGARKALEIPSIKEWFRTLDGDDRKRAETLFGKINRLTIDSPDDKRRLFKYSVLAFESLRYKGNLDALEHVSPENIEELTYIFESLSDIEATLYHQIIRERIEIIKVLQEKVDEDALEKIIQQHIFKNLWLLDPAWERATETPYMEQKVAKEFGEINTKLTDEERKGRVDIKYATTWGKHVIIELKRAGRVVSSSELIEQVSKYRNALKKILKDLGKPYDPIEIVCVVGRPLKDWSEESGREESVEMLAAKNIRVVLYHELIENAYQSYKQYLQKSEEAGRVYKLIQSLDDEGIEF